MSALAAAALSAGVSAIGSVIKRRQEQNLIDKQRTLYKSQKKSALAGLDKASKLTAEEREAMGRMKKGAEEGTMDVEGLNRQMAQPLYQQGEAQESQAMQKITQQGLEGSIIAQEVSRKVGGDVRASIATQARQIAMDNEKTKADAERRYQESQMKRGQALREIAMKKAEVERASQGDMGALDISQMQSQQGLVSGLFDAGAGFATSMYSNGAPNLSFGKSSRELRRDYTKEEREEMGING